MSAKETGQYLKPLQLEAAKGSDAAPVERLEKIGIELLSKRRTAGGNHQGEYEGRYDS
ncbi:MAG: hypothetical protein H0U60_13070 [Blastocatellia bacterium]|nr:hypothetical protein [Blastocatellia bacterium]